MSVGILGTKLGMTQVFDDTGNAVPVTVIQAGPCVVTQVKTQQTDGYCAVQLGNQEVAEKALRSEEHTSELQSPVPISYAVFCLKKKKKKEKNRNV